MRQLIGNERLREVEFDKEKQANLARAFNRRGEPGVESGASLFGEMKDFARRAHPLGFQLGLDVAQALKFFEEGIHLAHFQVYYLTQDAALKLLKHLVAMHRLTLKQS